MKSIIVIATLLISFIGPAHAGAGHDCARGGHRGLHPVGDVSADVLGV